MQHGSLCGSDSNSCRWPAACCSTQSYMVSRNRLHPMLTQTMQQLLGIYVHSSSTRYSCFELCFNQTLGQCCYSWSLTRIDLFRRHPYAAMQKVQAKPIDLESSIVEQLAHCPRRRLPQQCSEATSVRAHLLMPYTAAHRIFIPPSTTAALQASELLTRDANHRAKATQRQQTPTYVQYFQGTHYMATVQNRCLRALRGWSPLQQHAKTTDKPFTLGYARSDMYPDTLAHPHRASLAMLSLLCDMCAYSSCALCTQHSTHC